MANIKQNRQYCVSTSNNNYVTTPIMMKQDALSSEFSSSSSSSSSNNDNETSDNNSNNNRAESQSHDKQVERFSVMEDTRLRLACRANQAKPHAEVSVYWNWLRRYVAPNIARKFAIHFISFQLISSLALYTRLLSTC